MSFDDVRLPLRVGFGTSGGPAFSTDIVQIDGGYERRNQNWAQARRKYDAATGLRTLADAATLQAFFLARAGKARGFRLKDWSDFTSASNGLGSAAFTDQNIGTGNGTTTQFQLRKNYSSGNITHQRQISKPVSGTVLIGLNGVLQNSGWSIDHNSGLITFASAPSAGVSITAGFEFDVPVRFDTDQLSLNVENFALASVQIPLVEIRI